MKAIITSSEIIRKSGYGQYSIIIDMLIDGEHEVTHSFHTTDSQLFDDSKDNDFDSERLINKVGGLDAIIESFEFCIINRENGDLIDSFGTLDEAKEELVRYEAEDKDNDDFVEDFYQIKIQ